MDDKHSWNTIDVAVISTDTRLQMREKLSPDTVAEYKQLYIDAKEQATEPDEPIWPFSEPVEICIVNGEYLITNGFHRVQAAREVSWQWIRATWIDGTMQDALIAACGANATHGLQRSPADKRAAVAKALSDPVLCTYSDRKIADICKVSHTLVATIRKDINWQPLPVDGGCPVSRIGADGRERRLPQRPVRDETPEDINWQPLPVDGDFQEAGQESISASAPLPPTVEVVPPEPAKPTDATGNPLPKHLIEIFEKRSLFKDVLNKLTQLRKSYNALVSEENAYATHKINKVQANNDLKNFRNLIESAMPHAICPYCKGTGKDKGGGCTACKGTCWVVETSYKAAPTELRYTPEPDEWRDSTYSAEDEHSEELQPACA